MDDCFNRAGSAVTAAVVRQFTPSRIERELLAQVFELVCGQRSEADESHWSGQHTVETHRMRAAQRATETAAAGRRVA